MAGPTAVTARSLLRDRNLHIVFGVTLVAVMGVSSIAPALPTIGDAFDVGPERIGLLITAFTLPGVLLTPVLGVVADRFGRKRVLVPSLVAFALAGVACTLAPDFRTLLVLRGVQGAGAAALGALNLTVLGDLYGGTRRAAALGYNSTVLSFATAGYPVIGGALALVSWWHPFLLPLLALPIAATVLWGLDNPEPTPTDGLAAHLRRVGTTLGKRPVLGVFATILATFVLLYGPFLTYLPVHLDEAFGASSWTIGLVIASASATTAIAGVLLGRLTARFSSQKLIVTGFILYIVTFAAIPWAPSPAWMVVPALVYGLGQGLNIPSLFNILNEAVGTGERGAVFALNGAVLRLGQTLGPVLAGAVFATAGITSVFLAATGLAAGALVLLLVTAPRPAAPAPR